MAVARNTMRGAEPGRDDAHVLDRAVRQQALHVGLDRGVEDADQRRHAAESPGR